MNALHRHFERCLISTLRKPGFGLLYGKIINIGSFLRREVERPCGSGDVDIQEVVKKVFPDLTVTHGPFMGMRYPDSAAYGSSLFPKLLGSYEKELHDVICNLSAQDYAAVVDVGCAEGYYAVGLARMLQDITVHAYDISSVARDLCKAMAEMNHVVDRVKIGASCNGDVLRSLELQGRALVICDCEGYEKELLSKSLIADLKQHDFLVEAHDFINRTISPTLIERFKPTHEIHIIPSLSDHLKVGLYDYEELEGYNPSARYSLLEEVRLENMNWFYMKARD